MENGLFGVVKGHPMSLKIAPFDRAHASSYYSFLFTKTVEKKNNTISLS